MRRALALGLVLALGGCFGGDAPPPVAITPLHYGYLTPIRLNVAALDVQDRSAPLGPADIAAESPVPPAQALADMARERIVAGGPSGRAVFVIDTATITRGAGGTLAGQLGVHLDILTASGMHAGYAEARVARQDVPGSDAPPLRERLYLLTRQMMADMNVEFEYQVRRSLHEWLQTASAVPAPVTATPLPGSPVSPVPPGAPAAAAVPGSAYGAGSPVPIAPEAGTPPGGAGLYGGAGPYGGTASDGGAQPYGGSPPDGGPGPYGGTPSAGGVPPYAGTAPYDGGAPTGTVPQVEGAPDGTAPPVMSPPPGYLTPPPGSVPAPTPLPAPY